MSCLSKEGSPEFGASELRGPQLRSWMCQEATGSNLQQSVQLAVAGKGRAKSAYRDEKIASKIRLLLMPLCYLVPGFLGSLGVRPVPDGSNPARSHSFSSMWRLEVLGKSSEHSSDEV